MSKKGNTWPAGQPRPKPSPAPDYVDWDKALARFYKILEEVYHDED